MRRSEWLAGLSYLGLLVVLALAGRWSRSGQPATCANDGSPIEPLYQVRVATQQGRTLVFCCIRCAESWLAKEKTQPQAIFVTDESSGAEVSAASAFFVRGLRVTNPTTRNRLRAFAALADAEAHVHSFGGVVLTDGDRPFAAYVIDPRPKPFHPN